MSTEGIWTTKLGFVPWKGIKRYDFTSGSIINDLMSNMNFSEYGPSYRNLTYLNIFLLSNETENPDDKVELGDADERRIYEYTLYEMRSKGNSI